MTQLHYPSLELCKKLTEIGMKETEKCYDRGRIVNMPYAPQMGGSIVCPSVMEMLDIMPFEIETEIPVFLSIGKMNFGKSFVGYNDNGLHKGSKIFMNDTTPNALAEMVIWLHENDYISFTK